MAVLSTLYPRSCKPWVRQTFYTIFDFLSVGIFAQIWHGKCLLAPSTPVTAVRRVAWASLDPGPFLAAGSVLTICFDKSKHSRKAMCRQP
jgi:hypothetical protein